MVKFQNVTKIYGKDIVGVQNINLHVAPGEFVSIVGQSGTGKTTLAKLMVAEERPTKGKIFIGGWDITNIKRHQIPVLRRQMGVIYQDFKLLAKKTVFENISFALEVSGSPSRKIGKIVPQVMKIVGLENKADAFPKQLSGGQQQRVVIARSLVHRPKLIIADEPTGNLDSINAQDIINLLLKINKFGTTVILVTHNHDIVNSLRKRVITMDHGMIISDQKTGRYIL